MYLSIQTIMSSEHEHVTVSGKQTLFLILLGVFSMVMISCSLLGPWVEYSTAVSYSWANPMEMCVPLNNHTRNCVIRPVAFYDEGAETNRKLVLGICVITMLVYLAVTIAFIICRDCCNTKSDLKTFVIIAGIMTLIYHFGLLYWLRCRDDYRKILGGILKVSPNSLDITYNKKWFVFAWIGLFCGYVLILYWMADRCKPEKKKSGMRYENYSNLNHIQNSEMLLQEQETQRYEQQRDNERRQQILEKERLKQEQKREYDKKRREQKLEYEKKQKEIERLRMRQELRCLVARDEDIIG